MGIILVRALYDLIYLMISSKASFQVHVLRPFYQARHPGIWGSGSYPCSDNSREAPVEPQNIILSSELQVMEEPHSKASVSEQEQANNLTNIILS